LSFWKAVDTAANSTLMARRMVDLIEQTFAHRTTLKTVSAAMRGRPEQLGRLFRQVVGTTIHDYVTRVRLDHAAHFIRSGVKIEAVALSVGYLSKKNFYRQFTRHYGATPETYRRRRGPNGHVVAHTAPARGGKNLMTRYAATFADIDCLIEVEVRTNLKGRSSCVATPFVRLAHGIQPFVAAATVEIGAESEVDAIERAAVFLEHRFGPRQAEPSRFSNGVLKVLTPRI
jgi:AraC-like DNA-binding protein